MEHSSNLSANEYSLNTKIYFQCNNWNFLKIYGPILFELHNSNEQFFPVLLIPSESLKSSDFHLKIFTERGVRFELVVNEDPLDEFVLKFKPKFYICIGGIPKCTPDGLANIKRVGTKIFVLGYMGEEIIYFHSNKPSFEVIYRFCLHSDFWSKLNEEFYSLAQTKISIIGYPEFDQLNDPYFSKNDWKPNKEINGRKIIFLSTACPVAFRGLKPRIYQAGFFAKNKFFSKALMFFARLVEPKLRVCNQLISYRESLCEIRKMYPTESYYIVAKTRAKHMDPEYVDNYVDEIVHDITFCPFTTLSIMKKSFRSISFYSGTVFESLASMIPVDVLLHMPIEEFRDEVVGDVRRRAMYEGIWNEHGFSKTVSLFDSHSFSSWKSGNHVSNDQFKLKEIKEKYFSRIANSSRSFLNLITTSGQADS